MSCLRAPISKILTWSCVDGPGNRMVVFFQGCNFNCAMCHNPHTIGQCNHCGDCLPDCPTAALRMEDGKVRFDPTLCNHCDACLEACPIHANPMAQTYSVDEVLALVRENAAFLSGLTVSGGEATLHLPFIKALFTAMGEDSTLHHLTRFIDSNGHLGEAGWRSILDVTDGVMLDIKAFDDRLHLDLTKRSNVRSLASARFLHAVGKLYELRFLMVPERTDSKDEVDALIAFAKDLHAQTARRVRLRLNGFRTHGVCGPAAQWPALQRDVLEATADRLRQEELGPVTLPAL